LNAVFLANSQEAIWQLQVPDAYPWATSDGRQFIPVNSVVTPGFYLTDELLGAFEPDDQRRLNWVGSNLNSGTYYYYPYKYKVRIGSSGGVTEYYMVLRLAEQYLIRAEAEANGAGGGLSAAIADLNTIRERAGLPDYAGSSDANAVLAAIYHERQVELFTEWGHRWLDLKRTGNAHNILSTIPHKSPWHGDYQLLYPIPITEMQNDPNLLQNNGY